MAVFDGKLSADKYGPIMGADHVRYPVVVLAGEVFKNTGGKFVTPSAAAGTAVLTVAASTKIMGWLDCEGRDNLDPTQTLSYTAVAGDVRPMILGTAPVVYRVPVKASLYASVAQAAVGDACDLEVNSSLQTAAVGTTTRAHLIIVGIDPNPASGKTSYVDCIINPAILGSA